MTKQLTANTGFALVGGQCEQKHLNKGTQNIFKRFGKDIMPKIQLDTTKFNEEEEIDTSDLENETDNYDNQ